MNRLPSSPMPWVLGILATLLASFILVYYVNLLQESVARGSQVKYAQQENSRALSSKAPRSLVTPLP